jgi:hypothetical protein
VRLHRVPTSTETPIERGSVSRCDGQGVNREGVGFSSAARAVALPRQCRRRQGPGGQGALRRRVPWMRCLRVGAAALEHGCWPSASVVAAVWGSWSAARSAIGAASNRAGLPSDGGESRDVDDQAQSAFLCPNPRVIRRYIRASAVARGDRQRQTHALQVFHLAGAGCAHYSGRCVPGSNPGAPID